MSALSQQHCAACEGEADRLSHAAATQLHAELDQAWKLSLEKHAITRDIKCGDFGEAVKLFNNIAQLAETEGHHPDLRLHNYRFLEINLSTHAVQGLSQNDFILASKIDTLLAQ